MAFVDPGSMLDTVTLQQKTVAGRTPEGHLEGEVWEDVETRRADVQEDGGSLDRRAGKEEPSQRATVITHPWDEVTDKRSRFYWHDRDAYLRITGPPVLRGDIKSYHEFSTVLDPGADERSTG